MVFSVRKNPLLVLIVSLIAILPLVWLGLLLNGWLNPKTMIVLFVITLLPSLFFASALFHSRFVVTDDSLLVLFGWMSTSRLAILNKNNVTAPLRP